MGTGTHSLCLVASYGPLNYKARVEICACAFVLISTYAYTAFLHARRHGQGYVVAPSLRSLSYQCYGLAADLFYMIAMIFVCTFPWPRVCWGAFRAFAAYPGLRPYW